MSLTAAEGSRAGSLMERTALANDLLWCATHLRSTGQGRWVSVKPADIKGRQKLKEHFKFQVTLWFAVNKYAIILKTKDAILHSMNNP